MSLRIAVNPITCEAHGMCAELLPERITLDDWGYPLIDGRPLSADLLDHARRAAEACPTFALLLQSAPESERPAGRERPADRERRVRVQADARRRARPTTRRA